MTAPLFGATQNPMGVPYWRAKAGGTITKGALLKLDTTEGQVIVTTAITDLVIGVAVEAAASGDEVAIQTYGIALVSIGSAVALGDQLMPIGTGSGLCATGAGATAKNFGVALMPGAATPDFVRVLLACPNVNGIVQT